MPCGRRHLRVHRREGDKIEIRAAVEKTFGVRVESVNTMNRKGKRKRNAAPRPWQPPGHQARHCPPRRRRPHRPVRGLRRQAMALRKRKPTSPGRRFQSPPTSPRSPSPTRADAYVPKSRHGWPQRYGRMTARHRGGGHKQQYRLVDFRRDKDAPPRSRPSSTTRTATPGSPCCTTRRREALHPRAGELAVGDMVQSGRAPRSSPATPCRCATSRSAR